MPPNRRLNAVRKKPVKSASDKSELQIRAFRKAARELGCENNEELFQGTLRRLGKHKPHTQPKKQTIKDE